MMRRTTDKIGLRPIGGKEKVKEKENLPRLRVAKIGEKEKREESEKPRKRKTET